MNKKHWNTVLIDGSISGSMLRGFIKDSHSLVAKPAKKSKATPKNNQ
jgi:predicted DNA-binding protein (MmcQ/YjbR family)